MNGPSCVARHFVVRLAVLVTCTVSAVACGGSASETPPPLEPDPHAVPRVASVRPKSDGSGASDESSEFAPTREAPSTWGTGRPRTPLPAPIDGG